MDLTPKASGLFFLFGLQPVELGVYGALVVVLLLGAGGVWYARANVESSEPVETTPNPAEFDIEGI